MASPFTLEHLLTHVSRDEWEPLSEQLVRQGDPEPFPALNEEAWKTVDLYTRRFAVDEDILKVHWRVLVFYFGWRRLAEPEEKWEKAYEETMKFLREVRDEKFKDIPLKNPTPEGVRNYDAAHGSAKPLRF